MAQAKSARKSKPTQRERRRRKRAQQQRRARLQWGAVGLVAVALVGYVAWTQLRPRPGRAVLAQPASHIQADQRYLNYSTDPPNSGPHRGSPIGAGFYTDPPDDENLVHNLEHGYVVIWYNCAAPSTGSGQAPGVGDCNQLQSDIQRVMADDGPAPLTSNNKLMAVPRASLAFPIVATTWGRMLEQPAFDRAGLLEFIQEMRGRAPEGGAA